MLLHLIQSLPRQLLKEIIAFHPIVLDMLATSLLILTKELMIDGLRWYPSRVKKFILTTG